MLDHLNCPKAKSKKLDYDTLYSPGDEESLSVRRVVRRDDVRPRDVVERLVTLPGVVELDGLGLGAVDAEVVALPRVDGDPLHEPAADPRDVHGGHVGPAIGARGRTLSV